MMSSAIPKSVYYIEYRQRVCMVRTRKKSKPSPAKQNKKDSRSKLARFAEAPLLPGCVVVDVGARDGLQHVPAVVVACMKKYKSKSRLMLLREMTVKLCGWL